MSYVKNTGLYQEKLNNLIFEEKYQPVIFAAMHIYNCYYVDVFSMSDIELATKEACFSTLHHFDPRSIIWFSANPEAGLDFVIYQIQAKNNENN